MSTKGQKRTREKVRNYDLLSGRIGGLIFWRQERKRREDWDRVGKVAQVGTYK
jgi:hypothetical protein